MEELIDYKKIQAAGFKDNLLPLRNTWTKRLKGMQKNIEVTFKHAGVMTYTCGVAYKRHRCRCGKSRCWFARWRSIPKRTPTTGSSSPPSAESQAGRS
jgi:hypothetical protein